MRGHSEWRLCSSRFLLILLALSGLAIALGDRPILLAHASGGPALYISPASRPLATANSYLSFDVAVVNMPTFSGWNVYVRSNINVLAPEKITLGTFMPSGFESINCLNNTGTLCDANDGPGVAHDSFSSFGFAAGSGTLFTITYKAIAPPGTSILFPDGVTRSDSGGLNELFDTSGNNITGIPEVNGVYGVVAATSSSLNCAPSSVAVDSATTCTIMVTDTSLTPTAPTGTADFNSTGTGSFTSSPCTLTGSSSPTSCQVTYTPTVVGTGTHTINATYNGDLTHIGSTKTTTVTVTKATPTITTSLSSTAIAQGQSVTDSATLSGETPTAGGTVTYRFFSGSTCVGSFTPVGSPVTVTNGLVPRSASQAFNTVGSYSWNATYSGDADNNRESSACEPLTVTSDSISTTLSSSTLVVGGSVFDTATLTGGISSPGGTVDYHLFSTVDCSGTFTIVSTVTVTNGVIPDSAARTFNAIVPASWNAAYSGDPNNLAVTSSCELLTIIKTSPTLATSLTATIVNVGGSVNDTATLANGFQAGGTVAYGFYTGSSCSGTGTPVGNPVTVANGIVQKSTPQKFNTAGLYSWKANYTGDANNNAAESLCETLLVIIPGANFGTSLTSNSFSVGDKIVINVAVTNSSPLPETFTVRAKWGPLTVKEQNVTLNPDQSETVSLTWDTSQYNAGTANLTIAIPQAGTVQNVGPLTLNAAPQGFLSGDLPLIVGIGVAVVVLVAAAVWLIARRRARTEPAGLESGVGRKVS